MKNTEFAWNSFKTISLKLQTKDFFEIEDDSSLEIIEAWKRTFTSRLYYACFHELVEIAEKITSYKTIPSSLEFHYDRNRVHGDIRKFYLEIANQYPLSRDIKGAGFNISKKLHTLHLLRKDCDYSKSLELGDIDYIVKKSLILSDEIDNNLKVFSNHFDSKFKK